MKDLKVLRDRILELLRPARVSYSLKPYLMDKALVITCSIWWREYDPGSGSYGVDD